MNKYHIALPGNIRSKKNSKMPVAIPHITGKLFKRFKTGLRPVRIILLPSSAYKEWESKARDAARDQIKEPLTGHVHVKAVAYCKGVLPDLSGMLESVGDCLEGIAWVNDNQIVSWDGSRVVRDKVHQRTEIEVTGAND